MKRQLATTFLAFALGLPGAGAFAADPKPFPDFTFKRVKVPEAGAGKRITVQIGPEEEDQSNTTANTTAPTDVAPQFDWFWQDISPTLTATAPGRLQTATAVITQQGGQGGPSLQQLQDILGKYGADILAATIGTKVSPALVLAMISVESSGRADAVSEKGATGLMQLMPATAERFEVEDIDDPVQNIKGGVAFLDHLMDRFAGDPILVLAAYNAGEGAVFRYEGVPAFAETRAYVPKVLQAWMTARGLCLTPPELISDGCAFNLRLVANDG